MPSKVAPPLFVLHQPFHLLTCNHFYGVRPPQHRTSVDAFDFSWGQNGDRLDSSATITRSNLHDLHPLYSWLFLGALPATEREAEAVGTTSLPLFS